MITLSPFLSANKYFLRTFACNDSSAEDSWGQINVILTTCVTFSTFPLYCHYERDASVITRNQAPQCSSLTCRKNTVKRLKNDVDIVIHYRSIQYVIRPPAPSLHDLNNTFLPVYVLFNTFPKLRSSLESIKTQCQKILSHQTPRWWW